MDKSKVRLRPTRFLSQNSDDLLPDSSPSWARGLREGSVQVQVLAPWWVQQSLSCPALADGKFPSPKLLPLQRAPPPALAVPFHILWTLLTDGQEQQLQLLRAYYSLGPP